MTRSKNAKNKKITHKVVVNAENEKDSRLFYVTSLVEASKILGVGISTIYQITSPSGNKSKKYSHIKISSVSFTENI